MANGKERQPEQQVQVRPQDAAGDVFGGVEQVMMVVPVDAEINEAQHVAQEHRQQRFQARRGRRRVRHFHLQHHDGDDDGEHAVAERFQPVLFHESKYQNKRRSASHFAPGKKRENLRDSEEPPPPVKTTASCIIDQMSPGGRRPICHRLQQFLPSSRIIDLGEFLRQIQVIPADDAILDEPFAGFGHLLAFLRRLQEFAWLDTVRVRFRSVSW